MATLTVTFGPADARNEIFGCLDDAAEYARGALGPGQLAEIHNAEDVVLGYVSKDLHGRPRMTDELPDDHREAWEQLWARAAGEERRDGEER